MAKLTYSAIASLDGCVEDEQGGFARAQPDVVHVSYRVSAAAPSGPKDEVHSQAEGAPC